MNNSLYIERNSHVDDRLNKLVDAQRLVTCYLDKKQRILKNEKLVIAQKKKYLFLRVFSAEDTTSLPYLHDYLAGVRKRK